MEKHGDSNVNPRGSRREVFGGGYGRGGKKKDEDYWNTVGRRYVESQKWDEYCGWIDEKTWKKLQAIAADPNIRADGFGKLVQSQLQKDGFYKEGNQAPKMVKEGSVNNAAPEKLEDIEGVENIDPSTLAKLKEFFNKDK